MNKKPLSKFFTTLTAFFAFLLGRISWSCPPWLSFLCQKAKTRPQIFWASLASVLIAVGLVSSGYYWYKKLPQPELITAMLTAPKPTPVAEELIPDNLTIDFGLKRDEWLPQSVAPLAQIGKELRQGVTIAPAIAGKWLWQSDSRLVFTPASDWPAGQTYRINFAKEVFAKGIKLASQTYFFATQPLQARIGKFKFYQDPHEPQLHQAVATIHFNFPVEPNSLINNTSLAFAALKKRTFDLNAQPVKFTVTYDQHRRIAYLRSEALQLPEITRYLALTIDKGVQSLSGTALTTTEVSKNLLIPDRNDYLKVVNIAATIVRNQHDRPEQVLTIETSLGVNEAEFSKNFHAYLLPVNYPANANEPEKNNYQWTSPGEVTAAILTLATPLAMQSIPAERNYATLHSYKFNVQPARYLYVKLDKGTRGLGDFVLANGYVAVIKIPDFPKEISFLHNGALLALSSEKKLSVLVRGVPAVKFEIARVLPANVNQLVTQSQGDFNSPYFTNQSFDQQNISEIFAEIQQFDPTDLTKQQYTAVDLVRYLASPTNTAGPQGLFLLKARGWDTQNNLPLDVSASRLILMTNLGMVAKDNRDGSHDVFIQHITQGAPVANVEVSVLGKNGIPIMTRQTDEQGRASFPSLKGFIAEREPTVYLAQAAQDVSFIPYNNLVRQLNYSRYDSGGIYSNEQEQHSLTAYLFSDQGIYRPGDPIHVGMIVKQIYAQPAAVGLPLEVMVVDPRGTIIKDEKLRLDATGLLSFDFITQATSLTGQYSVSLYIVKDRHPDSLIGTTLVQVAEFQPDRMRINAQFSQQQKGWLSPAELTATVDLWNLYGAPATDRRISAKVLLAPQRVQFADYPEYIFADPLLEPKKSVKVFTDTLTALKTDEKGQVKFDLNLERFDKATYQLTFFAEGFEAEGGRSVTVQKTALVSPLAYFVGYKVDGDLNFIKQNSERSIHFIAVNPQLQQQAVAELVLQLQKLQPITTLVKKADSTYQYQSLVQAKVISTMPFSLAEQGADFTLPTNDIGDFALVITNKNNTELSHLKFSVVGASQLPLAKNAELTVKLDKPMYKAGEDIELQITAPYTGAGLITIERDKVYASQWFKTDTTSSIQKIHIPADFNGNGYVNVAFVRDWNLPDTFISPLSYSIVPFAVEHDHQTIHLTLATPATAKPGEPFTIDYHSDIAGKAIIFAVDEGILQVSNYKTPDPLAFFFQKRALEVITRQTLDLILPKFVHERELSAVGGDDNGEEALASHLNPFKRKTDLPVAYWSGIVDIDSSTRQLIYQIPDYFNGTLRVMAVAVAENSLGTTEKKSIVRGPFVINPNVPTFVAPGDEFEVTASVANNINTLGAEAKVQVELSTTPELEIVSDAKTTVLIGENQEKTVVFKLRAKSALGSARLTLVASSADKTSKMDATLSVRPATNFVTTINSGTSKDTSKSLAVNQTFYPEYRQVEAAISNSPLILLTGLQRYLQHFPYGCTEQLISKALPLLAMAAQPWFDENKSAITNQINTTIQMLSQRQMSNGGFSYWPGMGTNNYSSAFSSLYAVHFLTEAKAAGFNVSIDLLNAAISYLREFVAQPATNLADARLQAYAIYLLTCNEIVTTNYLTNLQLYLEKEQAKAWQQDITSAYIAATYRLLQSNTEANQLITAYKPQKKAVARTDFYNRNLANAQYLYLLARHFPEQLAKQGDQLVMTLAEAINNDEMNTVLSGYASLALSAYAQANPIAEQGSFSINETLADQTQKAIKAQNGAYEKAVISDNVQQVTFNNSAGQVYFYQLVQAGFDKVLATSASQHGLEISREYRNAQGDVLSAVRLGDELEVHLQIRALANRNLSNVAIVDLLPGGFEVVRDSVKKENVDYADIREDRVVFFTSVYQAAKEIIYRIKAINTGSYTTPSAFAESMYNRQLQASSAAGKITVTGN